MCQVVIIILTSLYANHHQEVKTTEDCGILEYLHLLAYQSHRWVTTTPKLPHIKSIFIAYLLYHTWTASSALAEPSHHQSESAYIELLWIQSVVRVFSYILTTRLLADPINGHLSLHSPSDVYLRNVSYLRDGTGDDCLLPVMMDGFITDLRGMNGTVH